MRLFWLGLLILWCIAIFYFTEQPVFNDEHTLRFISLLGVPEAIIKITDFIARKLAHVTLFFITAYVALKVVRHWRWQYLAAWAFATFYGMTDEWHQLYVPGRSGKMGDVMIDSTGALLCIAIIYVWDKIHQKSNVVKQ
ncbi:MAG: VanZ family protein [Desulfotomaculaceae bacterium]|nr:VanZ family protein [Desulfotomaculaceae bacterium]